jgi:hypothetical protein
MVETKRKDTRMAKIEWTNEEMKTIDQMRAIKHEMTCVDATIDEYEKDLPIFDAFGSGRGISVKNITAFMGRVEIVLSDANKENDATVNETKKLPVFFYVDIGRTMYKAVSSDLVILTGISSDSLMRMKKIAKWSGNMRMRPRVRIGLPKIAFISIITGLIEETGAELDCDMNSDAYIWLEANWGTEEDACKFVTSKATLLTTTHSFVDAMSTLDGRRAATTAEIMFALIFSSSGKATIEVSVRSMCLDFILDE